MKKTFFKKRIKFKNFINTFINKPITFFFDFYNYYLNKLKNL